MVINPEEVVNLRHPGDMSDQKSAADTLFSNFDYQQKSSKLSISLLIMRLTLYPETTTDWLWLVFFSFVSIVILTYIAMSFCRCLVHKYYNWRHKHVSQHNKNRAYRKHRRQGSTYYKQIRESLPLVLKGHTQVSWTFRILVALFLFIIYYY